MAASTAWTVIGILLAVSIGVLVAILVGNAIKNTNTSTGTSTHTSISTFTGIGTSTSTRTNTTTSTSSINTNTSTSSNTNTSTSTRTSTSNTSTSTSIIIPTSTFTCPENTHYDDFLGICVVNPYQLNTQNFPCTPGYHYVTTYNGAPNASTYWNRYQCIPNTTTNLPTCSAGTFVGPNNFTSCACTSPWQGNTTSGWICNTS